jgi:hypothetical protein
LTENRSRTYRQYFEEPEIVTDLVAVVGRFVTAAERHGMRPVVAFIPRTRFDREAAIPAIGALGARFGSRATFSEAGDEPGDWDHYNIKNADCHPSASGHVIIAAHLARVIEPLLATGRGLLARDGTDLP